MNKIFISCKESRIENNKSFYGCFYLGPFNEGESLTIANALRRTLLSECPGLAIISVLIEDVNHEYSTLSGVRDSVLDILLNLKEIVLKKSKNPWLTYKQKGVSSVYNQVGSSFFKPVVGYLKVKGPGIVRAKDLRLPPFIQCVDPDQYIATLSENGSLNMKFVIMEGKSYIIQKANSLVDYSFVKKRRILLKQLKELMMKSTWTSNKQNSLGLKEAVNYELFYSNFASEPPAARAAFGGPKEAVGTASQSFALALGGEAYPSTEEQPAAAAARAAFGGKAPKAGSSGRKATPPALPPSEGKAGQKEEKLNEKSLPNSTLSAFKNASPLNIDAVFSPIKKVNYIIEVSENKIVNNSNEKYSFMDNLSTLIESGDFYKTNFPFLTTTYSSFAEVTLPLGLGRPPFGQDAALPSPKRSSEPPAAPASPKVSLREGKAGGWKGNGGTEEKEGDLLKSKSGATSTDQPAWSLTEADTRNASQKSNVLKENFMRDLMEYVETYSTDELWTSSRSLHPLRKEGALHTVILEIWTNGSLHPREALSMAFSHLTSLFMNLEKTKVFNPIYKDVSSYKKCLNTLPILQTSNKEKAPSGFTAGGFTTGKSKQFDGSVKFVEDSQTKSLKQPSDKTKKLDIGTLNLNLRAYTQLKRANIKTIGDLTALSKKNLSEYYKLDNKSIKLINKSLEEFGLSLLKND